MRKKAGAYLTVYLSLSLLIILSLYLVMIDGVRRNGAGLEAGCAVEAGLQSVMGEYHRELFRRYNILAIDSSYGTGTCGRQNTEEHLSRYIKRNIETEDVFLQDFIYRDFLGLRLEGVELTHVSILTDEEGAAFRRCAVEAIKDDVGLSLLEQVRNWLYTAEINGLNLNGIQEERKRLEEEWKSLQRQEAEISEESSQVMDMENPMKWMDQERHGGFLRMVIPNPEKISTKAIWGTNRVSDRIQTKRVNHGNMEIDENVLGERLLFQEYLIRYMGNYLEVEPETGLEYQVEYLLNGRESDADNLEGTALKLCALRESANIAYLLSCEEKRTQAGNAATVICGLLRMPKLAKVLEAMILIGWAAAESIYDVKTLYDGGKIPLIKGDDNWHYGLNTSMEGQLFGAWMDHADEGLRYKDYLRILMAMTSLEVLTVRAMDMVETDIRLTPGNESFRMDGCYDRFHAVIHIGSVYGYEFEVARKREYR